MKVKFFVWSEESDVYEFPDDTTNEELETAASDWVVDNIGAGYEIVLDDEDEIIVPSLSSWADQAIVADAIQDAPTIIEAEGDSYQDD